MYFVAYIFLLKKNVVVPAEWICEIGNHFEKFVNNSLNSNQMFVCYYTNKNEAFIEDQPNKEFEPDFTLALVEDINGTFEGCFYCELVHFSRK